MKLGHFFTLMILVTLFNQSLAQSLLIRGIVLDDQTLKPLVNTSVYLDKKFSTQTDTNGFFLLFFQARKTPA
jgi:hypothetical protein